MTAPLTGQRCVKHPERPSLSTCVACGSGVCGTCMVHTPVGFKCPPCTGADVPPARPSTQGRSWRGPIAGAVAVGVTVSAIAVGLVAWRGGRATSVTTAPAVRGSGLPATGNPGPTQRSVQVSGAGGLSLGATLLSPPASGRVPGVLLVPDGVGATRDGLVPVGGATDPLYSDLAQALARGGIASLRYDPRGQGQSVMPAGKDLAFADLLGDAKGALGFLAQRREVDGGHLVVLGDGIGGLVAMQLAAQDQRVSAVALVSTPGRLVQATLADQIRATAPTAADGELLAQQVQAVATAVVGGAPVPGAAALASPLRPLFPPKQDAFLRAEFSFDPAGAARAVHVPILVVRGGADRGITAADVAALTAAASGTEVLAGGQDDDHTLSVTSFLGADGTARPITTPTTAGSAQAGAFIRTVTVRDATTLSGIVAWVARQAEVPRSSATTTVIAPPP